MSNPKDENHDRIVDAIVEGTKKGFEAACLDGAGEPSRYVESEKTVVEVGLNALALLMSRTEKLCESEEAGSVLEEQIRRNVETIAQGYAALKYR